MYTRPFLRSTRVILTAKFTDRAISPSPTVLSVTPPPEIRRGLFTKYIREIKEENHMGWIQKLRTRAVSEMERPVEDNPLDRQIVEKGQHKEVDKIYQARWVWYHTILAVEIAFTNILLLLIILILAFK